MANTRVIKFTREKTTKNTVKFEEVPEPGQPKVIGSLYVQQFAAGDAENVKVTIELQ